MYEAVAFPVSVCEIVARSRPLRHTLLSEHRPQLGIILPCSNTSPHTHTHKHEYKTWKPWTESDILSNQSSRRFPSLSWGLLTFCFLYPFV